MDIRKKEDSLPSFPFFKNILTFGFIAVFLFFLVFSFNHFKFFNSFPIKVVKVYGIKHLQQQEIQKLLRPLVNNNFFSVKIGSIRARLLRLPWVSTLAVRRVWPDQIEITLIEKNAIANWKNSSLLSEEGELFVPPIETYPNGLPTFIGPSGKQIVMLQYFNQINRILIPLHAKISYLELTPYLTWKLALDNGITLQMGNKDILTRLGHFVKVYPKIVGNRSADVEYIDLRYANGIAVRWKSIMMEA